VIGRRVIACVCALALSVGAATGALTAQAAGGCTTQASWGTADGGIASEILSLVNDHRASMGLARLSVNSGLAASANWKSLNMAGLVYFDHYDTDGRSPDARAAACGYTSGTFGENIAWASYRATAASIVSGWLNSPGHRANIEYAGYTSTGVGVAIDSSGGTYSTQDFGVGGSGGTTSPPPTPPAPPADPVTPPSDPVDPGTPPASDPGGTTTTTSSTTVTVTPAAPASPQPELTRSKGIAIADRVHAPTAHAGEPLTAMLPIVGADTATVQCAASVGARSLATHDGRFVDGKAVCTWKPQRSMRGKSLTGRITVQVAGQTVWAQFSRYVRAHR
jgi:uncharacterized protein YkwD